MSMRIAALSCWVLAFTAMATNGVLAAEATAIGGKVLYMSDIVKTKTPDHSVEIDIDIVGVNKLTLVVTDAGDGIGADWADWAEPRFVGPQGELKLTDLKWVQASTQWGQVQVNKNCDGGAMRINGKQIPYGFGVHANSLIMFEVPKGYERFKCRAGLDNGGSNQNDGGTSSVLFAVINGAPGTDFIDKSLQAKDPAHEAENFISQLKIAPGVEAKLFASEPMVVNPSDIDVDHRGRVWVCEVVNYRSRGNTRPEGDRILVLEDTNGDGVAEKSTVFYQGRDIDSALGICVLGNKVVVTCSPNVFVFTDEDGDLKADKKELLFTKTGDPQHDHSGHAFVFGPDGKYYWNFGNTGKHVHDKDGKPVVDKFGRTVVDNGKPYIGGMVFRCNPDGSEFEVLGHNFRNNYEVAVDSFGTLWQSDNDDDGNRGVRINYVMEGGNFGYCDEMTRAGWRVPYTNEPAEIPLRHWHLTDPGVVPNFVQTGAGSPTGICVYEGRLLPKEFWDQVIHADAGPNVVRAYPATVDGAGYKGTMLDLMTSEVDQWYRPSDVCVAPDGSVFVADWYDPGVGGHRMGDVARGRIVRLAPPGSKYEVPQYDFSTVDGAVSALQSPNLDARYLAYSSLAKFGNEGASALEKLFATGDNPRMRARALWLLAAMPDRSEPAIEKALADVNPDLRITGLRAARRYNIDVPAILKKLAKDPSPAVRREVAVALRGDNSAVADEIWTELALAYDGKDRWYLEALGIGADGVWEQRFANWLTKVGEDWKSPANRDIVWRSRAKNTPIYLSKILRDRSIPKTELAKYLRAFDFQEGDHKESALDELAFDEVSDDVDRWKIIAWESIRRGKSIQAGENLARKETLRRLLESMKGTPEYVDIARRFRVKEAYPNLLAIATEHPEDSLGLEAIKVLLVAKELDLIQKALAGDPKKAVNVAKVLGLSGDAAIKDLLLPIVKDQKQQSDLRAQALKSTVKTRSGAKSILEMAQKKQLEPGLEMAASAGLNAAPWDDIRTEAQKVFPPPASKNNQPMPPIAQLVKEKGDAVSGRKIYQTVGECIKCHKINEEGKEVGPALTEIGSKLSRDAMFESILFPSAGISHNYETFTVALADGNVLNGILTSDTADAIELKTPDAVIRKIVKSDIDQMQKSHLSLMPADIQKNLTPEDLVDLVEFLQTLKKK